MEMSTNPENVTLNPSESTKVRRVTLLEQINLNAFWIGHNFHWQALLAIVIPSMVAKFLGEANKDINLTLVVSWGSLVAFFVNPLIGAISDYSTFRLGRRRPFMIFGTVFDVIILMLFAFSPRWFTGNSLLIAFTALFLLLQFFNNLANSPWSAIIVDKVPQEQRGLSAGFNGLFTLLGLILGSTIAGLIVNKSAPLPVYKDQVVTIFALIAVVLVVFVTYTVLTVKETPLHEAARFNLRDTLKRFLFNPTHYPDFSWVLLARFLMMMGIWGVFYFLQYYFDDVLHVSGEQFSGTFFLPILLLTALPTSLLAGWASDHWGRKRLVYISGSVMTVVCILFIFFQSQAGALIAAGFFGIGYGAYGSVDWALTADTIPPTDEAGKFMGIWSAMGILPQIAGTAIGGIMLQLGHNLPNHQGYTILFVVTIIYFALGTLIIRQVRTIR